jgi:hypothetical protein
VSYYDDDPIEKSGSRSSIFSSILALVVLLAGGGFYLSSTLAANITLSSGGTIEFGQAVSQAVACSGATNLTVAPASTFVNAATGTGTHYLSSITVSNIPNSCYGADFTLNAFGPSSSTPLAIFNSTSTDANVYDNNGTFELGTGGTGTSLTKGNGTFTINFSTPVAASTSVSKVTIESGVHKPLVFGDPGPAGGTIFMTPTSSGGRGGSYFYELAPANLSSSISMCNVTPPTNLGTAIGYGFANTSTLAGLCGSGAAVLADNYVLNGYTDWFLPSMYETLMVCQYARSALTETSLAANTCSGGTLRPGFENAYVTSSTGGNVGYAWHVVFTGYGADYQYVYAAGARAVRRYLG